MRKRRSAARFRPAQSAQMRDEARGRRIERCCARSLVGDARRQPQGKLLAQLDPPLVERVDVPNRAFGEYLVLIESDQAAEHARIEAAIEECARRPAARKALVRREPTSLGFAR